MCSGKFIPDPDLDYFYPSRIPDQGFKKAPVLRFGSATLALSMIKPLLLKIQKGKKLGHT
jgi:hypothetical protein